MLPMSFKERLSKLFVSLHDLCPSAIASRSIRSAGLRSLSWRLTSSCHYMTVDLVTILNDFPRSAGVSSPFGDSAHAYIGLQWLHSFGHCYSLVCDTSTVVFTSHHTIHSVADALR
jgi:hypothetical protein